LLALYIKKNQELIGEAEFDLATYASKDRAIGDKLYLKDSNHSEAYIEILIRAKPVDLEGQTPRSVASTPTSQSQLKRVETSISKDFDEDFK
jgi:hypothetical protein